MLYKINILLKNTFCSLLQPYAYPVINFNYIRNHRTEDPNSYNEAYYNSNMQFSLQVQAKICFLALKMFSFELKSLSLIIDDGGEHKAFFANLAKSHFFHPSQHKCTYMLPPFICAFILG